MEYREATFPVDEAASRIWITDIVLERDEASDEAQQRVNLTELSIVGLAGTGGDAKDFILSKVSSRRWELRNSIELPPGVDALECVVKCDDGQDIGLVTLDRIRYEDTWLPTDQRPRRAFDTILTQSRFSISWATQRMHPEPIIDGEERSYIDDTVQASKVHHGGFGTDDELSELSKAISTLKDILNGIPDNDPSHPAALNDLGCSLRSRFQLLGDPEDITGAVSSLKRSSELTPEGDPSLPSRLNNLGYCLSSRFQRNGELQDITEAISTLQRSVCLSNDDQAELPTRLINLGNALRLRFEHTGKLQDIAEAISTQRKAVSLVAEGHAALPVMLSNLGNSLEARFERTGDLRDISEAISSQKKALSLSPKGHQYNCLGNAFHLRFSHTGDAQDASEAISALQRAVSLTPEGHATLPACLNCLGTAFQARFERIGDLQDNAEAILAQRRAVELAPEGHAELPSWLNNLGNSLDSRFEDTGDLEDISAAISAQRRAVRLAPEGHADLPVWLSNLGISLDSRFEATGNLEDNAESISVQRRAVRLAPEGHAELHIWLNNLGVSLCSRFERTSDLGDITAAISVQQRAVSLISGGHANLPICLTSIADSWHARYASTGTSEDLDESIRHYRSAATCAFGSPQSRLEPAMRWARLSYKHHPSSADILPAFDTAIHTVALIAGLEQTVHRRYSLLQQHSNLPLEAAAAAFGFERPDKALEWLEHGRCLVWGQLTILRSPLDKVRHHDAALADRIMSVSKQLESAGSTARVSHVDMALSDKMFLEDDAGNHLRLAREWDGLLARVRSIPGLEDFLQPMGYSSIVEHLPVSGIMVIVNVHEDRCDAIAILASSDKPLHIPLPNFTSKKAKGYRDILNIQLQSQGLRDRGVDMPIRDDSDSTGRAFGLYQASRKREVDGVHAVLECLWNEVVKPILEALGLSKPSGSSTETLPRLWWCPTGPLSFLPIHAAGVYRELDAECVADYVVSSYSPTVTALTSRVMNNRPIDEDTARLFVTSQPKAPGTVPIPGTTREVEAIYNQAVEYGVNVLRLEGDAASAKGCLTYMEAYSGIHFACHASQNAARPLRSRFLFHEGHLNLGDIMQRDLKNADMAFLSACQTSTGEETLSDEAVHLAAGMLAAGYRRVVATMWAIGDQHAPQVAEDFYRYLWSRREDGSGSRFDGALSAYALHHATQLLRKRLDNSDKSLLAWIPYVHFGY